MTWECNSVSVYVCATQCFIITVWGGSVQVRVRWKPCMFMQELLPVIWLVFADEYFITAGCLGKQRSSLVKMKSQTSLGLHSKYTCTCKHTLQWSGTLTDKDLYTVWRSYNIGLDSEVIFLSTAVSNSWWAANVPAPVLRKLWVEICVKVCYLFILTLRCKCFRHSGSSAHIGDSCEAHNYTYDESQH